MKGLKPKKKCCKDDPRCKRCPVVVKKLERQGYSDIDDVPKKAYKAARAR